MELHEIKEIENPKGNIKIQPFDYVMKVESGFIYFSFANNGNAAQQLFIPNAKPSTRYVDSLKKGIETASGEVKKWKKIAEMRELEIENLGGEITHLNVQLNEIPGNVETLKSEIQSLKDCIIDMELSDPEKVLEAITEQNKPRLKLKVTLENNEKEES